MLIRQVYTDDPVYPDILELRNRVLRIPLGMDIRNDDLSDEKQCQHLAYFNNIGEILGCLKIKSLGEKTFQVLQMAVRKDHQTRGIGTALINKAESIIREQGGIKIVIDARDYAIPFYVKNGYQPVGDFFEKINIPHLRMTKSL